MLWNFTWTNKQATSVGVKHLNTLEDLAAKSHQWPLYFTGIEILQIYHFISFAIPSRKTEGRAVLKSTVIRIYSPNTSKNSTKLVCNQQVAFGSNKYQEGDDRHQPLLNGTELALFHRHSEMLLRSPTEPSRSCFSTPTADCCHFAGNPLPVFIICITWPKEERVYRYENTMHKIIWKNMLENCRRILSLFLYFPLSITIR